ncbi:transposable element Tc3 transposase [Trichonephila clavipes]|nr:transposable element Tc3 transposase [Trichonephila clavipes]
MAVIDRSATSRTIAKQIQFVTHHSESAGTIHLRFQERGMPARCTLLRLPLTGNHRCLLRQWCDEMWTLAMEWNEIVFTDESRFCVQHPDGQIPA